MFYIVETGSAISKLADLKGKTLYASGKGAVPEYTLSYLLSKNGMTLGDVQVEWRSEDNECVVVSGNCAVPTAFCYGGTKQAPARFALQSTLALWEAGSILRVS